MKIELPKTLNDYKLRQIAATLDHIITQKFDDTPETMVKLVNVVTEIPVEQLKRVDMVGLRAAYNHIKSTLKTNKTKPPSEVKIQGVTYYFEDNLSHKEWTTGRFIDSQNRGINMKEQPEFIAAICYIEKGKAYGDVELKERAALFKEHFRGEDFVTLIGFFLRKYDQLNPGFSVLNVAKAQLLTKQALKTMRESG